MNFDLTPELEAFVQRKVESGLYNDPSEVVRAARREREQIDPTLSQSERRRFAAREASNVSRPLRLMVERDRLREAHLEKLREALAEGVAQANRGELLDGPEVVAELRDSSRRRKERHKNGG